MSAALNRVQIIGNLARKPEMKFLQSGQGVASFSVAVNEQWKGKDGEKQERTLWVRVSAWGKLAENCTQYLDKGRQVYVEGRLSIREYEKDGEKKTATEVVADNVIFLGGNSGEKAAPSTKPKPSGESFGPPGGGDDDFPF